MSEYKVINAMQTGEFEGSYGKMVKYAVQLELDGKIDTAELNQKPDTPAPKAGDMLSGTIDDTKFGKKFKKESKPYSGGGRSNFDSDGAAWGNALTNAVAIVQLAVSMDYKIMKPTPTTLAHEALNVAKTLYEGRQGKSAEGSDKPPAESYTPDQVPTEQENQALGLEEPF